MPSALLLLAATTALRVAIPSFDVVRVPGILSERLAIFYAMNLGNAKCAQAIPPSKMGPQAIANFAECNGNMPCMGDIGRVLGADFVLHGTVERVDTSYLIELALFDVHQYRVTKHLELRYVGKLSGIEDAIRKQKQELCTAVNPAWKDTLAMDALAGLGFEAPDAPATGRPGPAAKPIPKKATAPSTSLDSIFVDLPPMEDLTPPPPVPAATTKQAKPAVKPVVVAQPAPRPPTVVAAPPPVVVASPPEASKPVARQVTVLHENPVALPPPPPPAPRIAALNVVRPARPLPWGAIASAGAVAIFGTGLGFGVESHVIWSQDKARVVQGMQKHSITHTSALQGNRDAAIADVLFGVAAAAGVGAGVLVYLHGGFGIGGHF